MRALASGFVMALACGVAWADDGRVEINQARALAGGINGTFAPDFPGFPVQILVGGSYVLTSDLVVTSPTESAIQIVTSDFGGLPDATDVTLDLNGFSIRGPATCTGEGSTISCSGSDGFGVIAWESDARTVVVHNGEISGFGTGVSLPIDQGGCIARDLFVTGNAYSGISGASVGPPGTPRLPCLFLRNVVKANGRFGLIADGPAVFRDNVVHGNGDHGILAVRDPALLDGNTVRDNGGAGVVLRDQSLVANTASENNADSGIQFDSVAASLLIDNVVRNNGGGQSPAAPQLDNDLCAAGYVHQVLASGPTGGPVDDQCSLTFAMDPNVCNGSTTCP